MPPRDYSALARHALDELVTREHAVVWNEVEAKLCDQPSPTLPSGVRRIDPHHLTAARTALLAEDMITRTSGATRGGRPVTTFHFTNTHRRTRAITDATSRKRLLEARYLGWASGSAATGPGVLGPAGEAVVHASLTSAAPHGYRLINPTSGQVSTIYGAPVPGGPLDHGAFLSTLDEQGVPGVTYDVLVEVKNIRGWIYPATAELHQLLDKSARLQIAHPDRHLLPVLVCRRAHYLTTVMAEQLGFYVIQTQRQYAPPNLGGDDPRFLTEVQQELGYDLEPHAGSVPAMVKHFTITLPSVAVRTAQAWSHSAPRLGIYHQQLRAGGLTPTGRFRTTTALAAAATHALGDRQRWHRADISH